MVRFGRREAVTEWTVDWKLRSREVGCSLHRQISPSMARKGETLGWRGRAVGPSRLPVVQPGQGR